MNKISFLYPTVLGKESFDSNKTLSPHIHLRNLLPEERLLVVATVGMFFDSKTPVAIEADILFDGKSVINDSKESDNEVENSVIFHAQDDQTVAVFHLMLKNVILEKTGTYELRVQMSESMDKLQLKEYIDAMSSYFFVWSQRKTEAK